jgi:hypothetical protein
MLMTACLIARLVAQGDSPVVSASVKVIRKTVPVATVTLTNNRAVPLETWRVRLSSARGARSWTSEADFNGATVTAWLRGDGPIQAHETRTVIVRLGAVAPDVTASASMAVFADGTFEGNAGELTTLFVDRADKARDLAFWLDVLDATPRTTSKEADTFLHDRADEYQQIFPRDPNYLRERLTSLLDGRRPADSVFLQLDSIQAEVGRRLEARRRHLTRSGAIDPSAISSAPVASVTVRAEPGTASDIVALVENGSTVPIEAWRIEESAPPVPVGTRAAQDPWSAALPSNGVRSDTCGTTNQIKPHETREVFLHAAESLPDGFTPQARLTLVVFSTLKFEGRKIDFDQVLRQREFEAGTYQFWIDALAEAAVKPANEAVAFLRTRLDESESATSGSLDDEMATAIGRLASSASALRDAPAASLLVLRDALQKHRAALLRHTNGASGRLVQ